MAVTREALDAALTTPERERLAECEAAIARNLQGFVEAGDALAEIRDNRLYRSTHETFEAYCNERWNFGRNYANKLIKASEVVTNLGTTVPILPTSERQARALSGLEPETQREAWKEAVETAPDGKMTAAHVQAVADTYREETEDDRAAVLLGQTFRKPIAQAPETPACDVEEEETTPIQGAIAAETAKKEYSGDDWYTPGNVMDVVREVLGGIDLDPATSAAANEGVKADRFYTREDDGLNQPWEARRVFLNPPYRRGLVDRFVRKLIEAHASGDVGEAILLVNANTDSPWFQELFDYPICFWRGRLRFEAGTEHEGDRRTDMTGWSGSAFIYFGPNSDKFRAVFARYGRVVQEM